MQYFELSCDHNKYNNNNNKAKNTVLRCTLIFFAGRGHSLVCELCYVLGQDRQHTSHGCAKHRLIVPELSHSDYRTVIPY
jgi:hypothetical protein